MADGSYSDTGEPTQLRPRHLTYTNAASVGQSTAAVGSSYTDPVPSSSSRTQVQHRGSLVTNVPMYSDGFPYPHPKVIRRPVSRADWRASGKEKAKTLPFGKDQKAESLLSRLFRRNGSDNALQVRGSSSRVLSSVPSSISSSATRSGATFSNADSSSSICDGDERNSPTWHMQCSADVLSAPSSAHQPHGPALGITKRSRSEVDLVTEPDPFVEFLRDMHISRFGSCRDMALENTNDSGLASDSDTHLLRPHLPDTALDMGSCKDEASLSGECVAFPGEPVVKIVTQFHCSIENLTLVASQDDDSSSPTCEAVQIHVSDPAHAMEVGLHPQQRHKGKAASRPLSLCVPVEWPAFGDSRLSKNLAADTCNSLLNPPGKGRLIAAVSTMDIRTPPTSMKVVRASASYVDVHLISKIDPEDVSCAVDLLQWCRLHH